MTEAATTSAVPPLPAAELQRLATHFAARDIAVPGGVVSVRECGAGPVLVCLHGIGSGAASWLDTALLVEPSARLIAWDAPGYGGSTPLPAAVPTADDYVTRLQALIDALRIDSFVLVGHSLGALVAAAATRNMSLAGRIEQLLLISPAGGYGAPEATEQRERVRTERLETLASLGIAGMAQGRADRLLSDGASEDARQWVRWNMAQLHEHGYRQAIELLCNGDLLASLPPACPVRVLCGAFDQVTPPAACERVAQRCGVPLELLPSAGHVSYVEQPEVVAALLREAVSSNRARA